MKEFLRPAGAVLPTAWAIAATLLLAGCNERHGPPSGHDHDAHGADAHAEADANAHAEAHPPHGETEGGPADASGHAEAEAGHIALTPEQRERIGLETATAGPGTIASSATFPGEVLLNPDRLAHVVPRAAGIVREVRKTLGERVEADEILAWIESDALAEAKLAFFDAQTEIGCCSIILPRAKEIFDNTSRLLALLEQDPDADALRRLDGLEMGAYRGRLLAAYADSQASRKSVERERALHAKQISSGKELLEAEVAFQKAQTAFRAARDTVRFKILVDYTEAASRRQVAEFKAVAAEQRLRLKGADDAVIAGLRKLVPKTTGLKPCLCNDPDCKEGTLPSVSDALAKDERFAWYALRAPFAGFVAEKHLPLGEKVGSERSVFTIADPSSVWVRFNVYPKDLAAVKPGQTVHIDPGPGNGSRTGTVATVSPTLDAQTRTAPARVVLENADGTLRPGLYVTVRVDLETVSAPVVIPRVAVQVLDEEEVVFVAEDDGFEAVPVTLGPSDTERVIVRAGLRPGQRYVVRGGFELKSRIVSSGLDPHAGHGH
jgi:multidrug efflux pump subunit AcrA (membrane-fusion protein)